MANLYKPSYTKLDPETGERVARRVRKWYARYEDAHGVTRQVALCEDKQAAQAMLIDIVRRVDRIRAGIVDPQDDQLATAVRDHVEGYRSHLEAKARSDSHVKETMRLIGDIVDECRLKILADLQSADDRLEQYLARRRRDGASHRTVNADLAAIRSLCRWLVQRHRMLRDPTTSLEALNVHEDRRRERRALNDGEAQALIDATFASQRAFRNLAGPERAMLYLLSQRTGLRRRELQTVTPASFDFSASPPILTVPAGRSKRRRLEKLPLPQDVAEAFRAFLEGRPRDAPVWPGGWWRRSAEMIRSDLAEAEIPVEDDAGRVIDFHGQRTTFITNLSRAGVPPAMAQKLARHSDVRLTLGTYTQLDMSDMKAAVEQLPRLAMSQTATAGVADEHLRQSEKTEILDAWARLADDVREKVLRIVREATAGQVK